MKTIFSLELQQDRLISKNLLEHGLAITNPKQLGRRLEFEAPARVANASLLGSVSIGAFTYLGPGCEAKNCSIGRFCSIAANVALGPAEHPLDWVSSHPFVYDGINYFNDYEDWRAFAGEARRFPGNSKRTVIGNDVWIGRGAIIRQGISVGDGAVVAGGSFVNKDVPPYAIVGGVPAKPLRTRFPTEIVDRLLSVRWWDWLIRPKEHNIDYRDVDEFLATMENLLKRGELTGYFPTAYVLTKEGERVALQKLRG